MYLSELQLGLKYAMYVGMIYGLLHTMPRLFIIIIITNFIFIEM